MISEQNNSVCFCYSSATICTYGKAKLGVGIAVAFSIFYNIPRFFEVSWNESSNGTLVVQTWLRQNETYIRDISELIMPRQEGFNYGPLEFEI